MGPIISLLATRGPTQGSVDKCLSVNLCPNGPAVNLNGTDAASIGWCCQHRLHSDLLLVYHGMLTRQLNNYLTLNMRGPSYLGLTTRVGQYHGCWCPDSLRRKDISIHDIDYLEYVGPGLTWGRISSTCVISMWSNDIKCKYMFMFPLKNLAHKGTWVNTFIHALL